jgi:hypothetical protein
MPTGQDHLDYANLTYTTDGTYATGGIVDYNTITPYTNIVANIPDFANTIANTVTFNDLLTIPTYVTTEELDKFAHRIYKIISDHTKIDIEEDEFMALLKGENNE